MTKTNLFECKHLNACYKLQEFLHSKDIEIAIYSDYRTISNLDLEPTEFLYIEYPESIELLIQYWIDSNNIRFYQ